MAQQTAVEWLIEGIHKNMGVWIPTHIQEQAKAMEKEQIILAINNVSEKNVKYANMIVASCSQIEGELFMHNTNLGEQYYNETYGKKD
jgi:Na+-transporting NADH:ubiquinone oxidoreductase subunit NqrC